MHFNLKKLHCTKLTDKSIEGQIWPQCWVPNARECTLKMKRRSRLPVNIAELKLERELIFVSSARSTQYQAKKIKRLLKKFKF